MMKRIVVTGPESSGKTTLAKFLSTEFEALFVPEYARSYLEEHGPSYVISDLENIAIGHEALLDAALASSTNISVVFMDTWMLELRIWAQYRFGFVPQHIEDAYHRYQPDLYLLCTPDLDWEPDPLRENPLDRDMLFFQYREAIEESAVPFFTVSGVGPEREKKTLMWLEEYLH